MAAHLHHAHLFCTDLGATVDWWRTMLGGTVAFDGEVAGARNVFMRVGSGRLHLYDQPPSHDNPRHLDGNPGEPKGERSGAIHHLGVRTDDLAALVAHMRVEGAAFHSEIRDFGALKYIMTAAPDNVLLELFEVDAARLDDDARRYFDD